MSFAHSPPDSNLVAEHWGSTHGSRPTLGRRSYDEPRAKS
jgi:hypothetical protein